MRFLGGIGEQAARLSRRFCALGFAALFAAGTHAPVHAEGPETSVQGLEERVKAAFLYKIIAYVEWPASAFAQASTPISIGVMGADAIAGELSDIVTGRTVQNRPLEVRRLKRGELPAGLHILFIGRAESALLGQLAPKAQQGPVLIVTESEGALLQGSAINFVMRDGRVRFEISLPAAEKNGIRLSSRLLAVAQQVHTEGR